MPLVVIQRDQWEESWEECQIQLEGMNEITERKKRKNIIININKNNIDSDKSYKTQHRATALAQSQKQTLMSVEKISSLCQARESGLMGNFKGVQH